MELSLFYAITLTFLLAVTCGANQDGVVTDKNGNVTEGGKLADSKPRPTPLEEGMKPVFDATNFFLNHVLQPDDKGPPEVLIQSVALSVEQSDFMIVVTRLENNWQSVSMHYLGFGICIAIGLLFIIIMPIVGFCFCCCRICGNCGGRAGQMDPKFAKCKQGCYTVFLLLLTTVMLASVVCAFVTNDLFHTQITDKDRGYASNLNRSLTSLERYMDTTSQELKTDVVGKVNSGIDRVIDTVNKTGSVVINELKIVTEADQLMNDITALADDIPRLKSEFETLKTDIGTAKTDATQVENSLTNAKNKIKNGLQGCSSQQCDNAKTKADDLTVKIDLNQMPNMDPFVSLADKYVGLQQEIRDAVQKFDQIGVEMTKNVRREIDNAVQELNGTKSRIDGKMSEFDQQIRDVRSELSVANKYLEFGRKEGDTYGSMSVFVGVGLSCIFLLIVMLLYMGITFGVCGERPYDDARFCNKGVGANFLMAAVGFMFMFSAVLMLLTLILFLVGAPFETEVCRHLVKPLDSKLIERVDGYFNLGEFIYGEGREEKLTIREVLTECENNTAIYSALKLNRTLNLSAQIEDIVTQLKPELQKLMDDIKNQPYQVIEVIPNDMENKLARLKSEPGLKTDFTNSINELKKPITINLASFIQELRQIGINSRDVNDAITILETLNRDDIPALAEKLNKIRAGLESVKRINQIPQKVEGIEALIAEVESKLGPVDQRKSLEGAANQTMVVFLDMARALALELADMIENDVGRCRPVYNSYNIIVTSTCEDVLNPFNSFWCAFGLCLILFIPTIIFAVKLSGLYRKTDKYVGKPFENLGGSNVYPGDHIPLDDVRKPPPYRDTRAHPSAGYDNHHSSAPPLEYGQGMLDFEMPYAVPARKGLYPSNRDNRPLLDQQM